MSIDLLSSTSRLETPFISVTIAGTVFGVYNKKLESINDNNKYYNGYKVDYPNFMRSLTINKVNGTVNTYNLVMVYAIQAGNDPNLLEKVFSKAKNDRKITLTYGDYSIPSYIYKEEEALITGVRSDVDIQNSVITYTISCVSQALGLSAGLYNFSKRIAKPSDIILELLYNNQYGMLDIFYGMRDKNLVIAKGLIARDDKSVEIEAQTQISPVNYLNYLITCMSGFADSSTTEIKSSRYSLVIVDDTSGEFNGPYLKIVKITDKISYINSLDTYEIDVGYPGQSIVTGFSITDNDTYSILYDYSKELEQTNYSYRINNKGEVESIYSPILLNNTNLLKMTESEKTWWTSMTQYPISATLTIKGLLKPAILMTYVKINVLFYGRKHIGTGYYVVTKQTDSIDSNGFRTTLKLTRIRGDD